MTINIYLNFDNQTEEAIHFYKDALGGTVESMMRFSDAPMDSPESDKNKIMHATLLVGDTRILFSDISGQHKMIVGNNFSITLGCGSEEEISRVFGAISAGGTVTMPLQDTFWGARFGMCCDKYGINWMFNWDKPKPNA